MQAGLNVVSLLPMFALTGCGFTAVVSRSQNGTFFSPGYPQSYPHNARCTWNLTAPEDLRIAIGFSKFVTEFCCDNLVVRKTFSWYSLLKSIFKQKLC